MRQALRPIAARRVAQDADLLALGDDWAARFEATNLAAVSRVEPLPCIQAPPAVRRHPQSAGIKIPDELKTLLPRQAEAKPLQPAVSFENKIHTPAAVNRLQTRRSDLQPAIDAATSAAGDPSDHAAVSPRPRRCAQNSSAPSNKAQLAVELSRWRWCR